MHLQPLAFLFLIQLQKRKDYCDKQFFFSLIKEERTALFYSSLKKRKKKKRKENVKKN
jgi:hypothetical protein